MKMWLRIVVAQALLLIRDPSVTSVGGYGMKLIIFIYFPHRILFHFPALKIVKQNEEMKQ